MRMSDRKNDQKIENLLNLALDTPQMEREKSELLESGYQPYTRTWQVIVRCGSDFVKVAKDKFGERWKITELSGGYAIVTLAEQDIELLAEKGVTAVHNPASNLKLGSGIMPLSKIWKRGVNVTLGTDSAASNNTLDILREMN